MQQIPTNGPFLKSLGYCSTDTGAIPAALSQGFNVVAIVDTSEAASYPGCVIMSALLPPPPLVHMILSTDRSDPNCAQIEKMYREQYFLFLKSPEREAVIANILGSMYKTSHPILFYTEQDIERQFRPLETIAAVLGMQFGIVVPDYQILFNNPNNMPYGFNGDPRAAAIILDMLLVNGYITKEEYSIRIPEGTMPSPRAINIILSDYNYAFATMDESIRAAVNIIQMYRYQAQTGKICPVIQIAKQLDECYEAKIKQLVSNSQTRFGSKTMEELNQIAASHVAQLPK